MRQVIIKAIEAVRRIRSGMTDAALMEELGISTEGLHRLFKELLAAGLMSKEEMEERLSISHTSVVVDIEEKKPEGHEPKKPVIDAADAINCIRSGMDHSTLMKRYNLSAKGVQSLFDKLVGAKLITYGEIERRAAQFQESFVLDEQAGAPLTTTEVREADFLDILNRLRSGTECSDILEEYDITRTQLTHTLGVLAERGMATSGELETYLLGTSQHFAIRHRFSEKVIYEGYAASIGALVETAVKAGIDLSEADLSGANLARAELSGAILVRSDLSRSNLMRADLTGARLTEANLSAANLSGATVCRANLAHADLSDANLSYSYGVWAFLADANLAETNLTNADLSGANLSGAKMFETILHGTVLTGAYLKTLSLDSRLGWTEKEPE